MIYLLTKSILLPPGIFVVLGAAGIFLHRRHPALSLGLLCCSTLLLWAMSTLLVGKYTMRLIEPDRPLSQHQLDVFQPQAIVVLGADRTNSSPEYGGADQPGLHLLMRLRYAATVHRQYPLPILVSGGTGYSDRIAQAEVMAEVLKRDFQIAAKWKEGRSMTTWENATYSSAILQPAGIDRVLLVTEAFHMQRAVASFRSAGLCILPAPTFFLGPTERSHAWQDFIPRAAGLELTQLVLHEALGLLYYKLFYFSPDGPRVSNLPCPQFSPNG